MAERIEAESAGPRVEAESTVLIAECRIVRCRGQLSEAIFVVRLNWTEYFLNPSGAEVTEIGQLRDTWSSRLIYYQSWRSS